MPAFRRMPTELWVVPPEERPIVVAVIGTRPPWAGRVQEILERDGLEATVRSAHSVQAALGALGRPLDVVVVAHRDGSSEALRWIRRIRHGLSNAAIVVAVPGLDQKPLRGLLAAGADGLVVEAELERSLALVVRSVCAGQISVPQRLRYLIEPPALSHREKQILALVIGGCTNAEIAQRLCLGESTVKSHLSSAFRRLGVRSRREAAAAVLNHDEGLRQGVLMTIRHGASHA